MSVKKIFLFLLLETYIVIALFVQRELQSVYAEYEVEAINVMDFQHAVCSRDDAVQRDWVTLIAMNTVVAA